MSENNQMTVGELIGKISSYHKDIPIRVTYLNPPSYPMEKCNGFIKDVSLDTSNFDFFIDIIVGNPAHPD